MATTNFNEILNEIYYNPSNPGSFGSDIKLLKEAQKNLPNLKLEQVKDWLSGEITYTLHKNARKNYKREKYYMTRPLEQFQADLVDMRSFSRQNNGYKYILTVIDCFSKFAFGIPIKNKTALDVKNALKIVFDQKKPHKLQTDRGKEFLNSSVLNYLKKKEVHFFTTFNTKFKCAIVERFNRTLKAKMYKYFTSRGTKKYIDVLQNLINSYNNSFHRTIKTSPTSVNNENYHAVFRNIYGYETPRAYLTSFKSKTNLKEGDLIRRKYELNNMEKSYFPNWTDEIFVVKKPIKGTVRPLFRIETQEGQPISQRVYSEEIQKIKQNFYRIDKIVKPETRNNKSGYIVKWLNYSDKHNSWVPKDDLISFNARSRID